MWHTVGMRDYRQLDAWRRAHRLVIDVYGATARFPTDERFGLTSQMRRSATSIPTNISEGSGRDSDIDYARFLGYGVASATELEYQLLLARDLGYITPERHQRLDDELGEVRAMLLSINRRLKREAVAVSEV
jgi:four helix bundle protein